MSLSDNVDTWKRHKAFAPIRVAGCILVVVILLMGGIGTSSASTLLDRAACWSAWTNAFIYTNGDGRLYMWSQEGAENPFSGLGGAEMIEMAPPICFTNWATPAIWPRPKAYLVIC
jgi:hypothetical protein